MPPHLSPEPCSPPSPSARHYHPTFSIWLSVDPMADKYPGVSPYVYCGNNPVRLVDPDGRTIVDPNGEVCYTEQDGWLPNAPEDTKRIGDAMMETNVGKEQFMSMVNSKTKIQLIINSSDNPDKFGDMKPFNPKKDQSGVITLKAAVITIYERSISDYLNETLPGNISEDETVMGIMACAAAPTIDQYMGAVACHEAEHLTPENLEINRQQATEKDDNKRAELRYQLEKEPERKKYLYFFQLSKQKKSN